MEVPLLAGEDVAEARPAGARDGGAVALRDRGLARVPSGRFITLEGGEGAGKIDPGPVAGRCAGGRWACRCCARANPAARRARRCCAICCSAAGGLVGAGRDAAAFRRARRARGEDHPPGAGGRHVGGLRPVLQFHDGVSGLRPGRGPRSDRDTGRDCSGIVPDVTLVLDVSERWRSRARLQRGADADRYERLDALFHARVRQGFRDIAAAAPERCVLIAADGSRPKCMLPSCGHCVRGWRCHRRSLDDRPRSAHS